MAIETAPPGPIPIKPPAAVPRTGTAQTTARPAVAPASTPGTKPKLFSLGTIADVTAQRIGIYGGGGLGKTSLACMAPGPVAIFDFDNSLPMLKDNLTGLDVRPINGVETFADLLAALNSPMWKDIRTIVIDTLTKVEEMAIAHTIEFVAHEKGHKVKSIQGYGYGQGYGHVFNTFMLLLQALDAHRRAGRNVILIMHDCTATCPNPSGADFLRYEPRLQNTDKGNVRAVVREWVDHLLFVGLDVDVNENGKARGEGSRTIYPVESATRIAKSRSLRNPIVYQENSDELWKQLFPKGA